jgi:uncharacterized protein YlxW (UPF0749 family)
MKEKCRRIKALFALLVAGVKMPAWTLMCLYDALKRAGDKDDFHREIVQLQRRAYELQKRLKDVKT